MVVTFFSTPRTALGQKVSLKAQGSQGPMQPKVHLRGCTPHVKLAHYGVLLTLVLGTLMVSVRMMSLSIRWSTEEVYIGP
jgi:hypothetical protein